VTHRLAVVLVAIAGAWSLVACSSVTLPPPCDLTIIALPADSTLKAGDPLPAASEVLAAPNDFDRLKIAIVADTMGNSAVNLELKGDAIARVAAHTVGHTGEFMAIAVNGTVVAVPMIQGPLLDGALQVTGAQDGNDLAQRFAGCVS
jgi:preprotein translocase subunit SecD